MRKFIYNSWNIVMNDKRNPLSQIPDTYARHMIMQVLAWMWCIVFSMSLGSIYVFGFTVLVHLFVIAGIAITVATFESAKNVPLEYNQ
jgi:hypothetical protein